VSEDKDLLINYDVEIFFMKSKNLGSFEGQANGVGLLCEVIRIFIVEDEYAIVILLVDKDQAFVSAHRHTLKS